MKLGPFFIPATLRGAGRARVNSPRRGDPGAEPAAFRPAGERCEACPSVRGSEKSVLPTVATVWHDPARAVTRTCPEESDVHVSRLAPARERRPRRRWCRARCSRSGRRRHRRRRPHGDADRLDLFADRRDLERRAPPRADASRRRPARGRVRLDRLRALAPHHRTHRCHEGRCRRRADARRPRGRDRVRRPRPQHHPRGGAARQDDRGVGHRSPLQLPRGSHRCRCARCHHRSGKGRSDHRARLLLQGLDGRRPEVRWLEDQRPRAGRPRPAADDGGLQLRPDQRASEPAVAREARDLRRPLARRPADRDLRLVGLRRQPGDDRGCRLPSVRGLHRSRHRARRWVDRRRQAAESQGPPQHAVRRHHRRRERAQHRRDQGGRHPAHRERARHLARDDEPARDALGRRGEDPGRGSHRDGEGLAADSRGQRLPEALGGRRSRAVALLERLAARLPLHVSRVARPDHGRQRRGDRPRALELRVLRRQHAAASQSPARRLRGYPGAEHPDLAREPDAAAEGRTPAAHHVAQLRRPARLGGRRDERGGRGHRRVRLRSHHPRGAAEPHRELLPDPAHGRPGVARPGLADRRPEVLDAPERHHEQAAPGSDR
ncbi:MAG: hypothetical protein J7513_11100 [Solirubrobacteraceae bacterium]|nr:hypothetical protein [Solirubrobacteraceae bacterium]